MGRGLCLFLSVFSVLNSVSCKRPRVPTEEIACSATQTFDRGSGQCIAKPVTQAQCDAVQQDLRDGQCVPRVNSQNGSCPSGKVFHPDYPNDVSRCGLESEMMAICEGRGTPWDATTQKCSAATTPTCTAPQVSNPDPAKTAGVCVAAEEANTWCQGESLGDFDTTTKTCENGAPQATADCAAQGKIKNPMGGAGCFTQAEAEQVCQQEQKVLDPSSKTCVTSGDVTGDPGSVVNPTTPSPGTSGETGNQDDAAANTLNCSAEHQVFAGGTKICCPNVLQITKADFSRDIVANESSCSALQLRNGTKACTTKVVVINPEKSQENVDVYDLKLWELPGTAATSGCTYKVDDLSSNDFDFVPAN